MFKQYPSNLLWVIAVHCGVFSALGVFRHWGHITSVNDLGCYDQAIWGVINKGFLWHSFDSFGSLKFGNWLGIHFNPILYFFVPFYYVIPSVNWIVLAQSAALSVAALPIFLVAKQVTQSERQALLWGIGYLFNPFVLSAEMWDFHPVSFAVPFIALGFLAIEQQNPKLLAFASLILLLCQEQFGLTVACLGWVYGFKNKETRISSFFFVLGIIAFAFVLTVIIPSFSPTQQHYMFSPVHGNSRYSWLGHSLKEIITTLVFSSASVFKTVMFKFGGAVYISVLLLPFLCVVLFAPLFLLPMSADLLANVLSANPMPRSIFSYHSVTIIPVLTVAAIYGGKKVYRYCSFLRPLKLAQYSCFVTVIIGYLLAPLPLPLAKNIWQPTQLITKYDKREDEIKALVGYQSVSAQINIGAHFSQREEIYRFPSNLRESDYVILWLNSPTFDYEDYVQKDIQMPPTDYLRKIEELLHNNNFKIAYWNDPWLVFKREPNTHNNNPAEAQILAKIRVARKNFQTHNPLWI